MLGLANLWKTKKKIQLRGSNYVQHIYFIFATVIPLALKKKSKTVNGQNHVY